VAATSRTPERSPPGWRLVKSAHSAQIDAVIALAIAAERAEKPVTTPPVIGWI
jgi:anti-sigma-K factor RskA